MAYLEKNNNLELLENEYKNLTETKRDTFSKLCNKLLNDNFIYCLKQEDKADYYDLLAMRKVIEAYFSLMDYELICNDTYKIFGLKTNLDRNRYHFKKLETIMIIILRLKYYEKSLEINSNPLIQISFKELFEEINKRGLYNQPPTQTEIKESLKTLKRFKLIEYDYTDLNDDNNIIIYPTLLLVVNINNIDELNQKIDSYKNAKEDIINEIEEN